MLGEEPIENRGARAADVEVAGGRWSKTNAGHVAQRYQAFRFVFFAAAFAAFCFTRSVTILLIKAYGIG